MSKCAVHRYCFAVMMRSTAPCPQHGFQHSALLLSFGIGETSKVKTAATVSIATPRPDDVNIHLAFL